MCDCLCKLIGFIEPYAAKGCKFLVCDKLCVADFWIGGLYTNILCQECMCAPGCPWDQIKSKFPCFCAYGERFKECNKSYIDSRPKCPF